MDSIAAYADDGSNSSQNDDAPVEQKVSGDEEGFGQKAGAIDAMDDNAEDGYAEEEQPAGDEKEGKDNDDNGDDRIRPAEDSRDVSSSLPAENLEEVEADSHQDPAPVKESWEDADNTDNPSSDHNGLEEGEAGTEEEEEKEDDDDGEERVMPQALTTPFSLASFLTSVAPKITEDSAQDQGSGTKDRDLEVSYVNGTYVRVAKDKVDMSELDRRLDYLHSQRREEIGLLKMYGLDDREDRGGGVGGRDRGDRGGREGDRDRDDSYRGRGDRDDDFFRFGSGRHKEDNSRGRDREEEGGASHRSRSRDQDRGDKRERRRSRSRERRRSRSRDRSSRRERGSEGADRGRRDDKDKYGRDRDREDKGRDRERSGRERDRFGRDREPDERKDNREHGSSRSPRSMLREAEKGRNDTPEKFGGDRRGGGGEAPYPRKQDMGYSGGQDFYPSQQPPPPMPVPIPDSFPQNQFQGPQDFSHPPPPLDPFNAAVPPPHPWMGGPPPNFHQPPPQQAPLYSQPPPPPLPPTGAGNPMNNGDPGYGASEPSMPPSSAWAMDTGYADSGPLDDDPMDLDVPAGSDDFQNRVVEEVKNAILPYFTNGQISKDGYREILKKSVPKVTSSGEINVKKIAKLVGAYVKKMKGRAK